jgi:RNA polymerase sigma-70 factor (ECF subfamily)
MVAVCLAAVVGTARAADDDEIDVKTARPVVVRTVPAAGADDVDPATTEIRVTFSKDMADGSWSWSTASAASTIDITAKPHYEADKRTCVAPVKLKPGTTYATWLNSGKFHGFQDTDGRPAMPYLLVFKTKG